MQHQHGNPDALHQQGLAALKAGRLDEAIAYFQQAIALKRGFVAAYYNLGYTLSAAGKYEEAIAAYRLAIQYQPGFVEAHANLAVALRQTGRFEEAIASSKQAIALYPKNSNAWNTLANALRDMGNAGDALEAYRKAIEIAPGFAMAHSNVLYTLQFLADRDSDSIYQEHCRWYQRHAAALAEGITPHLNVRDANRRLRVGYVSSDFRDHPVAYFSQQMLANHDPAAVEVFCYSQVQQPDEITGQLRKLVHQWRDIFGMSDDQLAQKIREDQIDILVDLSGHTGGNRLLTFARKPAPVQVTYLGYPDTTGLAVMDYRITDAFADPPGMTERLHSEKLVRLPETFLCFQPIAIEAGRAQTPALETGQVTFGCFNALPKISPMIVSIWSEILQQLPGSRLLLKSLGLRDAASCRQLSELFASHGIGPDRLELIPALLSQAEHLRMYNRIDIALDSFPYHGTTTTCQALWMGVPVVTLAGARHVSRVGVSILSNLNLQQGIAESRKEYVSIALSLAGDLPKLSILRQQMRSRMAESPLMNGPRFTANLESAYRQMWQQWCCR